MSWRLKRPLTKMEAEATGSFADARDELARLKERDAARSRRGSRRSVEDTGVIADTEPISEDPSSVAQPEA